jgi:hypothetical protein
MYPIPVTHAEESDAAVQTGLVQLHLLVLNIIAIRKIKVS